MYACGRRVESRCFRDGVGNRWMVVKHGAWRECIIIIIVIIIKHTQDKSERIYRFALGHNMRVEIV